MAAISTRCVLPPGVTSALDAGSAGPVNLLGFRKLVYERSKTRMIAFVALAQHGVLNEPGELLNLGFADLDGSAQAVIDNRDLGVGIKVRLHKKSIGDNSREALRLAIKAGEASGTPMMVHVGSTAIGMDEIADTLRPATSSPIVTRRRSRRSSMTKVSCCRSCARPKSAA